MKNILNKTSIKYLLQFLAIIGVSFAVIITTNGFSLWNETAPSVTATPAVEE